MPIITGKTIDQLNQVTAITASDELVVYDAEAGTGVEPTKKVTGSNLASSVKTLGSLLGTSDVVNDLTSTSTDKPGSANMLKMLNDKISIHDKHDSDSAVTVTPASGVTVTVVGAKSAEIKYLKFTISNTSLINAKEICTIPSEWCPVAARPYFPAFDDIGSSIVGMFILNASGKLFYYGQTTNDTIICCGLYM